MEEGGEGLQSRPTSPTPITQAEKKDFFSFFFEASLLNAQTAGYLFNFPTTPVPSTLLQALCNLMCGVVDLPVPGLRATPQAMSTGTIFFT